MLHKGNETILLIDDEIVLLHVAGKLLAKNGYNPLLASTGKEAIEVFNEKCQDISVVVLDIVMPEMNGREVEKKLREIDPGVQIIFSSGYSKDCVDDEFHAQKTDSFVQKPFDVNSLCKAIRNLIDHDNASS